jgi:hypothetical protein
MGGIRNAFRVLVYELVGKRLLGRNKGCREENT